MIKLIDRYILAELLKPFTAGVAAFLIIMVSNTLYMFLKMIVDFGLSTWVVVQLLLYNLPAIAVVTLPVAYMFATLLALGRLAKDSEIIVLRACGVSLARAVMPVLIVSLLVSGFGYWLNETVVPWANRKTVDLVRLSVINEPLKAIKAQKFIGMDQRHFYVEAVDRQSNILRDVYVVDRSKAGYPQLITAQLAMRKDTKWIFSNGMVRKFDAKGYIDHEIKFQKMEIEMPIKEQALMQSNESRSVRELSGSESAKLIEEKQKRGDPKESILRDLIDYYLKISLPLATFFTSLLAAPIGIRFSKMGSYFGVAVSITLVFIWYVVYSIFTSLGYAGKVEPLLAAWVQNILFGGIGAVLLLQMMGVDIFFPFKAPFLLIHAIYRLIRFWLWPRIKPKRLRNA